MSYFDIIDQICNEIIIRMLGLFLTVVHSVSDFAGDKSNIIAGYFTMIKLQHIESKIFLSSLEFRYPRGSFQQIVRGITQPTLAETYWTIFPTPEDMDIPQGRPVECGATIRLQHAATGAWLHSHDLPGHFGSGYEVTGFDGSDSGDFWEVQCNDEWTTDTTVKFRHLNTGFFLNVNVSSILTEEDGGGTEVYASEDDSESEWVIGGGLFVEDTE